MIVLLLGGTGAMGVSLANILSETGNKVIITSRKQGTNKENIHYIKGNAMNSDFLTKIMAEQEYDCVVDFLDYSTDVFCSNVEIILRRTKQYMFLSSSRVYAPSNSKLLENSPRLLDICDNQDFVDSDEYPIHKAKEEDYLKTICESNNYHYTIIRPYITYNTERIQLGVSEKEQWLFRALAGRTIVFPKELGGKWTTLSYGFDVSKVMAKLIGNERAINEVFHVAGATPIKWRNVLNIYIKVIEEVTGKRVKVLNLDNVEQYEEKTRRTAQLKYDRLSNRIFDNSKVMDAVDLQNSEFIFIEANIGLEKCLKQFLANVNPRFREINPREEAYFDKLCHEITPLSAFVGAKAKIKYLILRYTPFFQ